MSGSTRPNWRCGGGRGAAARGARAGPQPPSHAVGSYPQRRERTPSDSEGAAVAWRDVAARRSYGTGSLLRPRRTAAGRETWYGQWRANGRQVKRRIGAKRADGARDGLTRTQAEAELRRLIGETQVTAARRRAADRRRGRAAATSLHAERRGRKRSTVQNIESEVRVHLAPFFREPRARRDPARGRASTSSIVLEDKGLAPKTISNVVATLSALFNFAMAPRRRWATSNPCDGRRPAGGPATRTRSAS